MTPLTTIVCGGIVGLTVGPYISDLMKQIGEMIRWGTEQQPFLMGIVVSVLMGMALTLPISSAALGIILNLSGIAAGSSNDWVLCTDDRICDGQFTGEWNWRSIGTGNRNIDVTGSQYCKKTIDLAATDHYKCHSWSDLYCSFKMTNNAIGSGMGTAGFVGPMMTYKTMTTGGTSAVTVIVMILVMQIIAPAFLTYFISEAMRRAGLIKDGDMKLDI